MLRRGRSVPIFSLRVSAVTTPRRYQGASRDKQRSQPGADGAGNQLGMCETPDFTQHVQFGANALENVRVPEYTLEERYESEMERERRMRNRFGEGGPGEPPQKSIPETRRDIMKAQQDIDGLPWEVRWRKTLIPTPEEIVQEIRDRFDLYIMDPIEREVEWYLHWKDRGFKAEKDRLLWPQGYTDYLDHYDEHGRRRVLPSDQRWSDTSWKHLSDTNYRNRMWLLEGEQRKAAHQQLQDKETLLLADEQRVMDQNDVFHAMQNGIIDINPDQVYEALSGTANPVEVAKTKLKIQAYGAKEMAEAHIPKGIESRDPITGLPKSDLEPLPCGLTVEQGAHVAASAALQLDMIDTAAELALVQGKDSLTAAQNAHFELSKQHKDVPVATAMAKQAIANIKKEQALLDAAKAEGTTTGAKRLSNTVLNIEESLQATLPPADEAEQERPAGFIEVTPRPKGAEPKIPREMYDTPKDRKLEAMPEWYRKQLVEVGPMITTYDQVHDPVESAATSRHEYYVPPVITDDLKTSADRHQPGAHSAFDERKVHKEKTMPELVNGYRPLPLYREAVAAEEKTEPAEASDAATPQGAAAAPKKRVLKRSDELKKEREERAKRNKEQYDPDVLLPSLPWETSSVQDPYRGVAKEDRVKYDKVALEKTWAAYRGTFQQMMTEFGNMSGVVSDEQSERLVLDTIQRFRKGEVGDHPPIDQQQEEVFRILFEGHTRQFMSDLYKSRGGKSTESAVAKQEADELLKRAGAKAKLQGPSFMNFIQEMTALELDEVRKNPIQRYAVLVKDRKLEPIAKPFLRWIEKDLMEFNQTKFSSQEQLETQLTFLSRIVNEAKNKSPARIEGVTDSNRDMLVTAMHCWCKATLNFFAAKKHMELYLSFAETRFRSRAESLFEDAYELYGEYAKASGGIVSIPVPDCETMYDVEEKDFLDGENGTMAEVQGHLDKAEAIWHSGTSRRWYPMLDETEYMWFNERRGRISLAMDISARCLESLNKKSHPSVHPFPERAYPFLEGAPLTQETAEHLWLRHMGDIYFEHTLTMARLGQFATARDYLDRCHNLYRLAIRSAKERLPASWKAPLLTTAKFLMRTFDARKVSAEAHCTAIERTTEALYAMNPQPAHWIHIYDNLPIRVALTSENIVAYGQRIQEEAVKMTQRPVSDQDLLRCIELRAVGQRPPAQFDYHFEAINKATEKHFRQVIAKWRAKEVAGSDPYYMWTHLYFAFRVYPKSPQEVAQYWEMYEPAYFYFYTQAALGSRSRGYAHINDAIRRMSQILLEGDSKQKQTLLTELVKIREKLAHVIERRELDRAITTLEAHLVTPSAPAYCYGSSMLLSVTKSSVQSRTNVLLQINTGAKDYAEIKKRVEDSREGRLVSSRPTTPSEESGGDCTNLRESPPVINTRNLFAEEDK